MTLEKLKRIASAVTASCVLLLFILISVMVYQMITINAKKAKIAELDAQIKKLELEQEALNKEIKHWLSEMQTEERARELNYTYPNDK